MRSDQAQDFPDSQAPARVPYSTCTGTPIWHFLLVLQYGCNSYWLFDPGTHHTPRAISDPNIISRTQVGGGGPRHGERR
jgi:hypothetical protein